MGKIKANSTYFLEWLGDFSQLIRVKGLRVVPRNTSCCYHHQHCQSYPGKQESCVPSLLCLCDRGQHTFPTSPWNSLTIFEMRGLDQYLALNQGKASELPAELLQTWTSGFHPSKPD